MIRSIALFVNDNIYQNYYVGRVLSSLNDILEDNADYNVYLCYYRISGEDAAKRFNFFMNKHIKFIDCNDLYESKVKYKRVPFEELDYMAMELPDVIPVKEYVYITAEKYESKHLATLISMSEYGVLHKITFIRSGSRMGMMYNHTTLWKVVKIYDDIIKFSDENNCLIYNSLFAVAHKKPMFIELF